ncbi:hypothetical protein NQ315_001843 [Exocentrus adspersus]|uniref:Phosphatidylinositol-glycan biosynthesis class X protein n=1 Tax=Exocentrus adspersus TaxID=1586481 RepID=A0AAV8WAL0_9CUCU|nr:hypothetical protein NQ315_001843 [Exocentrus adspersus]
MITRMPLFLLFLILKQYYCVQADSECLKLDISITQKVEHEGFHREIRWLIETTSPPSDIWVASACKLSLQLKVSPGIYVYPDEVAELNRTRKLLLHIDGHVDVEAPAHEATEHTVYIYLNNSNIGRISIVLPMHLRYQRGQITGGYGKVPLRKPSLLSWCPDSLDRICGKGVKVEAPCDETATRVCVWKNLTYQAHFDEVELFVPVGDLDDYPLVSIVTLLLGCAGCIYILSVLSMTHI